AAGTPLRGHLVVGLRAPPGPRAAGEAFGVHPARIPLRPLADRMQDRRPLPHLAAPGPVRDDRLDSVGNLNPGVELFGHRTGSSSGTRCGSGSGSGTVST